jgi:hypothetical protein
MSAAEEADGPPYVIWSNEHQAWWRKNSAGYTIHLREAGWYSHGEALTICANARDGWRPGTPPPELPVSLGDAMACEARCRSMGLEP